MSCLFSITKCYKAVTKPHSLTQLGHTNNFKMILVASSLGVPHYAGRTRGFLNEALTRSPVYWSFTLSALKNLLTRRKVLSYPYFTLSSFSLTYRYTLLYKTTTNNTVHELQPTLIQGIDIFISHVDVCWEITMHGLAVEMIM